jgi:adenosine deaminase
MPIQPLADVIIPPRILAMPKVDLHLHQEEVARFERVIAQRKGILPHNWRASARNLMAKIPPGFGRLVGMYEPDEKFDFDGERPNHPEWLIAKMTDALQESANGGAILAELRFGVNGAAFAQPNFMTLFREAERQIQQQKSHFCAEAICYLLLVNEPNQLSKARRQFERCLSLADEGLSGIDFITSPYDAEADQSLWLLIYDWAERAANVGLGITIHAGEFSTANLEAALKTPGLQRVGHAVHASTKPQLMDQLVQSSVSVECSLSCNVVLGAVSSYESHPIKRFVEFGIPVTINTDDPVRVWTTIDREYAIANLLGFSLNKLVEITHHGIQASFTSPERKEKLLANLNAWAVNNIHPHEGW